MRKSGDERDMNRRDDRYRRNDRESRRENSQISRCHRQSKPRRLSQDSQRHRSISVERTRSPKREPRGKHYRISKDYRKSKPGNFSQDAQKDQDISDRRPWSPNRKSRRENSQISRCHRQLKRRRLSQDSQRHRSISVERTRYPERYNTPPMMPFRDFLISQENVITDKRALAEYNEYKLQFQRIQLNNFFVEHKNEEWFRNKYHPDDSVKEKEKQTIVLKKRLEVFKEFLANGKIDSVSVDIENSDPLVHLLDSVIIKLEGGTDFDLTVLNSTESSKIQQNPKHEKKETNENTNASENSNCVVDNGEKNGDETNKKDKYLVNKNNESMDVDVKNPEIFNLTNNNDQNNGVKPRALHRTSSICLRNLAPRITKSELETICQQYAGFRRLHIGDPLPDHLWHRHGWVTYDGDVRINDIFRNLKTIRLHGNRLGVNDIKKGPKDRILPVNGITNHFQVARYDIKLCARIINHLDNRSGLWQSVDEEQPAVETNYGIVSQNPVLHNIIDYVIDEASAEEEELLGESVPFEPEVNTEKHILLKVLDRMLLYLRIVHSVDFYNCKQYANEDNMPSKCHIMHARCAPTLRPPTKREIADYCHYFRSNAESLVASTHEASEREIILLGARDEEEEIKIFMNSNTKKISKKKWLCHLSGKKFISPEFVRKHIIRRYPDQLNHVKKEVKYFNNYLRDLNRPQPFPRSRPAPNL